jgi:Flp pilus assembly protein TadD
LGAAYVYDDEVLIRTNRWVQDASVLTQLPAKPLLASPPVGTTNYYRPLVVVLYNLTWQSLGGRPLAFHLLNVLVHMLNATLLLLLVARVTAVSNLVAVGAALLFAVHPLTSEAVAWPSCLPELGYTAFGLAALLFHLSAWNQKDVPARKRRIAAYVSFALACSCKETALAIIPLVAVLELWIRPGRESKSRSQPRAAGRSVVPYVVVAAMFMAARTAVLGGLVARGEHGSMTVANSILSAPWLLLLYWKSMLVPIPLLVEHVIPLVESATDPRFILGVVGAGAVRLAIVRMRRKRPDLAFAACLSLLPVLPALYLPALGRDPFAERYAYLGIAGMCWLILGSVDAVFGARRTAAPRWVMPSLLTVLVVGASARTIVRCGDWHDDESLGRASMRDEPRAAIGYLLVGNWQARSGRKGDALTTFEDGVAHAGDSVDLQINAIGLGTELGRVGPEEAIAAYQRLVPLAPGNASIPFNLGQVLLESGRRDEARAAFTHALELAPASVGALTALAVVASQNGDTAASVAFCRRALAVDDHSTAALQQLGVALMRSGDFPGAVAAHERAVKLDPGDKDSLSRLGVAYARTGRLDDARRAFEQALAIDPNFESARQNLERLRRMTR